jgi:SAM-dependent methyltransferase
MFPMEGKQTMLRISPRTAMNRLRYFVSQGSVWPPIDYELADLKSRGLLRGTVLNAGCGWRQIGHLIEGTLVNQDLSWPGDTRTNVDIFSPLHQVPRPNSSFDCVVCIAVLEHVVNPIEVVTELFRVAKPGGYVVASVPFLQPQHKVPTDFQRYTRDGLEVLFTNAGFVVEEVRPIFSVYHSLHWLTYEWLHMRETIAYKVLRVILLPSLLLMARRSTLVSDTVASVFRLIARKPADLDA